MKKHKGLLSCLFSFKNKDQKAVDNEPEATQQEISNEKVIPPKATKKRSDLFYSGINLLLKIGWIILGIFIILQFVVGIHVNSGVNMEPLMHDHDVVFYSRLSNSYEVGNIVVFNGLDNKTEIGRIVAKGGDIVDITEEGLKINGYFQTEPYAKGTTDLFENSVRFPVNLAKDEYFILFDNRNQGGDSRIIGKISADNIKGHVFFMMRANDF